MHLTELASELVVDVHKFDEFDVRLTIFLEDYQRDLHRRYHSRSRRQMLEPDKPKEEEAIRWSSKRDGNKKKKKGEERERNGI